MNRRLISALGAVMALSAVAGLVAGTSALPSASAGTAGKNGEIALLAEGLSLIHPDGSGRHQIVRCPGANCSVAEIAWSPHGRKIAFVRGKFSVNHASKMGLYMADAGGGNVRRL